MLLGTSENFDVLMLGVSIATQACLFSDVQGAESSDVTLLATLL